MTIVAINARGSSAPLGAFASVAGELARLAAAHREPGDVAPHAILPAFPRDYGLGGHAAVARRGR